MDNDISNKSFEKDTLLHSVHRLQHRRVESIPFNEEEAFQKAIEGYKYPFQFDIGSLSYLDLVEIGQDPPNVDLKIYKSLQLLDKAQLLKKTRGIERFYPTITKKDLFFYLTRKRLPEDIRISQKLERLNKFEKLLPLNQDLILLLYQDPEAFAEAWGPSRKNNIEEVIFLYDELMGIRSTPALIEKLVGIDLKMSGPNVESYLYWKLYRYIEISASQTPNSGDRRIEALTFEKVIGFNKDEFQAYTKLNYPTSPLDYGIRSDFVMQEFYDLFVE